MVILYANLQKRSSDSTHGEKREVLTQRLSSGKLIWVVA